MRVSGPTAHGLFAERLRQTRRKRGLTQQELAKRSGLRRAAIAKYEASLCRPNVDNLQQLSRSLGVSSDYLIDVTDEDTAPAGPESKRLMMLFKELSLEAQNIVLGLIEGISRNASAEA